MNFSSKILIGVVVVLTFLGFDFLSSIKPKGVNFGMTSLEVQKEIKNGYNIVAIEENNIQAIKKGEEGAYKIVYLWFKGGKLCGVTKGKLGEFKNNDQDACLK
jgi:hypothetical protein